MLKEQGLVVETKKDTAIIQTVSKASCSSCQVNSSCGTGIISKAFGERSFITPIPNLLNAQQGDLVEIGIPEDLVVKTSLLVYLLPLGLMLGLSLLVGYLFPTLSELWTIASAIAGLIVGFAVVSLLGKKISKNNQLEPVLLRIVSRPIDVKQVETS